MSECRIARRVAWGTHPENPPTHGGIGATWATKVFHWLFPFSACGAGRCGRPVARLRGCVLPLTGVGSPHGRGGERRVGWTRGDEITPLTLSSLTTNGGQFGGVA